MTIAITEEHLALGAAVRRFLDQRCPPAAVRATMDATSATLPDFWSEFASLGWLGLHLPEEHGGAGFGLAEAGVVLDELGRAGAPGPFLPTMLASAIVARWGSGDLCDRLLPDVAAGKSVAALVFPASGRLAVSALEPSGADPAHLFVSGAIRPVPGATLADWVVVPVEGPGGVEWFVMDTADLDCSEVASLDPTWRSGQLIAHQAKVPRANRLDTTTEEIQVVMATMVAAQCAGGAAWCLDTAVDYAGQREQFGRPIGQFQAVKHKCANMLVAVEQARATAWDAANALSESTAPTEAALAGAIAGAIAPEAFFATAKECIQVLGGIGFTWDHDAHRYLRRAASLRQLVGGPGPWRALTATAALAGARRRLRLELGGQAFDTRAEVAGFVESIANLNRSDQRARLVESGYFVPHWPPPWGRSADAVAQLTIDEELARGAIRRPNLAVGAWAAPTIATHGTDEQQQRWVGPTLRGEITWCQLFSEPGAGSDLASLTTRAIRTEGGWSLSGQKVWTSLATEADWGICLARTDPQAPKHLGITYFIVDMNALGIEVRPLRELSGMSMFNEVFLTEVFVADDCVIGPVNGGWPLARTTLANERVAMGKGSSFGGGVEALLALSSDLPTGPLGAVALDQLGAIVAEAQSVALLGLRSTHRSVAGADPGPEASVRKLLGAEHDQRTQEFGLGLLGSEGATTEGAAAQWTFGFLANRCLTIAGGTSEIQRNVIAERLLGLPRDLELDS